MPPTDPAADPFPGTGLELDILTAALRITQMANELVVGRPHMAAFLADRLIENDRRRLLGRLPSDVVEWCDRQNPDAAALELIAYEGRTLHMLELTDDQYDWLTRVVDQAAALAEQRARDQAGARVEVAASYRAASQTGRAVAGEIRRTRSRMRFSESDL